MTRNNFGIFILIFWACTKFLPREWMIASVIAISLICLYGIITNAIKYRNIRVSDASDFDSPLDDEEKPTKSKVKANLITNIIGFVLIGGALCYGLFRNPSIESDIETANKTCPVTITMGTENVTFHSLDYDGDYVVVNVRLDSSDPMYVDMIRNAKNSPAENKMAKYGLCYKSDNPYKVIALKHHKGIKVNYFFNEIGDGKSITIPYDEIVAIDETPEATVYNMELEQYLTSMNSYLPEVITDGYEVSRFFVEGDYVVSVLSFDDKKLDYQGFIAKPEELKKDADNALAGSTNPNDQLFMLNGLTARCGKGRITRIKTVYSNDSIDIVNTPEEVKQAFSHH